MAKSKGKRKGKVLPVRRKRMAANKSDPAEVAVPERQRLHFSYNEFTPRRWDTDERFVMRVSEADAVVWLAAGRRIAVKGTFTDLNTGKRYEVRGASCGLSGCHCDAVAREWSADSPLTR